MDFEDEDLKWRNFRIYFPLFSFLKGIFFSSFFVAQIRTVVFDWFDVLNYE